MVELQFIKPMYSLPREIHREIISWLEPEEQQVTRLTDRYFAGLILPRDVDFLKFGIKYGRLGCCEIGLSHGNSKRSVCETAARHGRIEVLKWARSQGCPWDEYTYSLAAKNGHLEVLKWLRSQRCPWDKFICSWAADGGHLEVLQWVRKHGGP
jgi:hypothetical protein